MTGEGHDPLEAVLAETVDVAVAARILRLAPRTVRDWCRIGRLRARRLTPRSPWRVYRESLDRVLREATGG